jgi:hypothetical protein
MMSIVKNRSNPGWFRAGPASQCRLSHQRGTVIAESQCAFTSPFSRMYSFDRHVRDSNVRPNSAAAEPNSAQTGAVTGSIEL